MIIVSGALTCHHWQCNLLNLIEGRRCQNHTNINVCNAKKSLKAYIWVWSSWCNRFCSSYNITRLCSKINCRPGPECSKSLLSQAPSIWFECKNWIFQLKAPGAWALIRYSNSPFYSYRLKRWPCFDLQPFLLYHVKHVVLMWTSIFEV